MTAPRSIIATTAEQRNDAFSVRIAVFVDEQRIPRSEELDGFDASATHCAGYVDDTPVAAGRLLLFDDYAKIGRMAVLASHRGTGLGARVLDALEREGVARGVRHFRLSAQLSARGFYERRGYSAHGDVCDDVGIAHVDMEKRVGRSDDPAA